MSPDELSGEAHTSDEVGRLARPALLWSFLNTVVGRFVTTAVGIIMARILVPEDYGVYAIAAVALNALLSANELGVSLAIVRWPGDPRKIAPSVNAIAILSSLTLAVLGMLLAPRIAEWMNAPQATGVLRLLLLAAVIDGITSVPAGLLTRSFRQKTRALIDLANMAITSIVAISMGLLGLGAWSLAAGQLAGNVLAAIVILRATRPYPGFGYNRGLWVQLIKFGAPLAAASGLVFLMLNADYIVIGNQLGPVQLGVYFLAFNLSTYPVAVISVTARRVALAAYSRLTGDSEQLAATFVRSLRLVLAVAVPACTALALLAAPLISVVYGSKWSEAATVLAPLAFLSVIRIVTELIYDLLVAVGRTNRILLVQGAWVAALVPALVIGTKLDGIRGAAIAHLLVAGCLALPLYVAAASGSGIRARLLARAAIPSVVASVGVVCVVTIVDARLDNPLAILIVGLLGSGLVALALQWRVLLPFVRSYLPGAGGGGQPADAAIDQLSDRG